MTNSANENNNATLTQGWKIAEDTPQEGKVQLSNFYGQFAGEGSGALAVNEDGSQYGVVGRDGEVIPFSDEMSKSFTGDNTST